MIGWLKRVLAERQRRLDIEIAATLSVFAEARDDRRMDFSPELIDACIEAYMQGCVDRDRKERNNELR